MRRCNLVRVPRLSSLLVAVLCAEGGLLARYVLLDFASRDAARLLQSTSLLFEEGVEDLDVDQDGLGGRSSVRLQHQRPSKGRNDDAIEGLMGP